MPPWPSLTGVVLQAGSISLSGSAAELMAHPDLKDTYLGEGEPGDG